MWPRHLPSMHNNRVGGEAPHIVINTPSRKYKDPFVALRATLDSLFPNKTGYTPSSGQVELAQRP